MSDRREKIRAGIALLEAAAGLMEQAENEFGGEASDLCLAILKSGVTAAHDAAKRAVYEYDQPKKPR